MDISEIRDRINSVDEKILESFIERMHLAEDVVAYKRENRLPLVDKARERAILSRVQEQSGAYERYAYELFHTLIELSKVRQYELLPQSSRIRAHIEEALSAGEEVFPRTGIIACQGVEGANSQAAADRLFPRGTLLYVKTFEAVFDAVESGMCQFGVLPIENSTSGSVRAVYDLLQQRGFSIVRMLNLHVSHELLVNPGANLSGIREIFSHEQALSQCSSFLASLDSGVKITPCGNTAMAAQMVAESGRADAAAISSASCAKLYGLSELKSSIQDSENNYTRFICVSKKPAIYAGANRISLILSSENEAGSLYNSLSKLAVRGINMSKLESFPVVGRNFEFGFYIDIDASVREPGIIDMLEELENSNEDCLFLGNYAVV